jgi:phage tail P2-like protein
MLGLGDVKVIGLTRRPLGGAFWTSVTTTSLTVGSPVIGAPTYAQPLNNLVPSVDYSSVTAGSPYALVDDSGLIWAIDSSGNVYLNGVLWSISATATLIEKIGSTAWVSGSFPGGYPWAYYSAGVFIYSATGPNEPLPDPTQIASGQPVVGSPQLRFVQHLSSPVDLVVGSPVFGAPQGPSPLGSAIYAPTGGTIVVPGAIWTFGSYPAGDTNNRYVLRNGAYPNGKQLAAYQLEIDTSGVVWVQAYNGQWYYWSGTDWVPSPAAPKLVVSASGLTVGRPAISLPTTTVYNVYGFTVGRPDIGAPSFIGITAMPDPVGIQLGPSSILVARPVINEVCRLKAENLVVFSPAIDSLRLAVALDNNEIGTTDPIIRPLDQHTGSELIYRSASGLEKAMADVDGFRLTATYAELIKDQWDPYAISYHNLPFLAFAMGVNLWEADWDESFRRWWVANQWTLQSMRGSLWGITQFVQAVGGKVRHAIVPPAKFFPGKSYTDAEKQAYVARFPQLRLYPYVARIQLPYLCFCSKFIVGVPPDAERVFNKNGCFIGPSQKFYPTSSDAGGRYTRSAVLYDPKTGVETPLTFREITTVGLDGKTQTVQEIVTPSRSSTRYYVGQENHWPLPADHPPRPAQNKHSIFLGAYDQVASRIIKIVVPSDPTISYAKATYQTISFGDESLVSLYPDEVSKTHYWPKNSLANGAPKGNIYLRGFTSKSYLTLSRAWQYRYEVWYVFDPTRVPDYRKASVYMGHAQFGQHKYTAKIKIDVGEKWRPWWFPQHRYLRGFWHPSDLRRINAVRRAVTASMAVRDTVGIDTLIKRVINTNDSLPVNGKFTVGEFIDA